MPSASIVSNPISNSSAKDTKETMETPQPGGDTPLGQAVQMLEKKVRNLEKRKAKLDGYRADSQRGKELNDDQKLAISKYEEVLQTLEFARELSGQFKTLIAEEDKTKKKLQKKEQQEKAKGEARKLSQVLEIQDMLFQLSKSRVRSDFTNGNHNAVKLTKDQLGLIDEFAKTVSGRKLNDPEYAKNVAGASDQLLSLLEGKATKKTGKTNFKDLKDLFDSIKACGYFQTERPEDEEKKHGKGKKDSSVASSPTSANGDDRAKKDEAKVEQVPEPVAAEPTPEPVEAVAPHFVEVQQHHHHHPQQQQQQPPREAFILPHEAAAAPVHHPEQIHHAAQQQQQQPPSQQIDFFQDSQIDMNTPHMDPAVVMVQHTSPQHMMMQQPPQQPSAIPSQTFTNQMYIPTTLAALQQHEHFITLANQQQQPLPQTQQQPPQQPPQEQHFDYAQDEQVLAKRMGQVGLYQEPEAVAEPEQRAQQQQQPPQQDAMANIDEWENDQAGNATGNGTDDFSRTGSWRGRGRGGRGGPNGGGFRGERRGGYRGDRDGGDRDNGYRGDRGSYRGRGGDRPRGGERGGPRRDGPRTGDREFRGGPRGGSGNSAPRGGGGRPYPPRSNGYHDGGAPQ